MLCNKIYSIFNIFLRVIVTAKTFAFVEGTITIEKKKNI